MADESKLKSQGRDEQSMAGSARRSINRKPVDQHCSRCRSPLRAAGAAGYLAALGSLPERSCKGSPSGDMTDGNRPVRTRMPGGVGGAGSIPVPTRFGFGGSWRSIGQECVFRDLTARGDKCEG